MKKFLKEVKANGGLFAVFEDDGETGYLYSYSPSARKIYMDLIIYQQELGILEPAEKDVMLVCSKEGNKCGAYVGGQLRGYIVFPDKARERLKFSSLNDLGIATGGLPLQIEDSDTNAQTKKQNEIPENFFVEDRIAYWKNLANKLREK